MFGYGEIYEFNDKIWVRGKTWTTNGSEHISKDFNLPVDDELQPRIIVNNPMSGFKIERSVTRYSTSNKLWRILDPRGFECEITTGCLEEIILNGTIINGEIQGECVWKENKNLQLVSG